MNPLLRLGMRLGPSGRRRVAVMGGLVIVLPCVAISLLSGLFAATEYGRTREGPLETAPGIVDSVRRDERRDGNASVITFAYAFRYEYRGAWRQGRDTDTVYRHANEAGRRQSAGDPRARQFEQGEFQRGDRVTVWIDPGSPGTAWLHRPPARGDFVRHAAYSVAAGVAAIVLLGLGWRYLRDPVEVLVAGSPRADALVAAALGAVPGETAMAGSDAALDESVATVRRREGTTRIEFRGSSAPAFRASALFPPLLLLVAIAGALFWYRLEPGTLRGAAAWAGLLAVASYIAITLRYGRAPRTAVIRNGVLEIQRPGLFALRRQRVKREQLDHLEARWGLSEVGSRGDSAFFDVVAVLGNGKRLTVAEGLPGESVADAAVALLARELGLFPEQARGAAAARRADYESVRSPFSARPPRRPAP